MIQNVARLFELDHTDSYENLLDAIIGSRAVRCGPRPSPDNCKDIKRRLDKCVREDRPIKVLVAWGSEKGYNQFPVKTADLLDGMALKRLVSINASVRRFYPPGIQFTVFVEDYSERIVSGRECGNYPKSLKGMAMTFGWDGFIHIVKESSLITDENYPARIYHNAEAIRAGREDEVGWRGRVNWPHYLKRAASELPNSTEKERQAYVSLFLGAILAGAQTGLTPNHDLKISFVPYPKGVPDCMRLGRLEYKIKRNKNSRQTPAPWVCFGVVRPCLGDWTYASVNDVREKPHAYECIGLNVNGHIIPTLRGVLNGKET